MDINLTKKGTEELIAKKGYYTMKCHYCDNDAVTGVGIGFCTDHLGNFEVKFFERAVRDEISSTKEMQKFFKWAFGTASPKLSQLADWHSRIPRPENPPEEWDRKGMYVESQDNYIRKILKEYKNRRSHETS